ncbi:MAG: hypothetical protein RIG62_00880 [Cyclobacteriaceae bacterium]
MEEITSALTQDEILEKEQWQRSIPAQIFLNYFYALRHHIEHSEEAYALNKLPSFQQLTLSPSGHDQAAMKRHLLNSWNTEYAIRQTAALSDTNYQQHALYWTFPQAYYSVEESLRAMLRVHGRSERNPSRILSEAGRLVKRKMYPASLSFCAFGEAHHPSVYGLPQGRWTKPGLALAQDTREAQSQLRQFLRTTHRQRSLQMRNWVQGNPQLALRSERSGEVLQRFNREHWQKLAWRTGYTTVFHLLQRLVVSANHREIERFVVADINMALFHQSLLKVIGYINFVHEAYVAQAVGAETYEQWLAELPDYLQHGFIRERYQQRIAPVLLQDTAA